MVNACPKPYNVAPVTTGVGLSERGYNRGRKALLLLHFKQYNGSLYLLAVY